MVKLKYIKEGKVMKNLSVTQKVLIGTGAVVLAANRVLTHTPTKPSDMDQAFLMKHMLF